MTQAEMTEEHPLVGQTIASKYKIVRLLGEGGMGCVYLGEQMLGTTTRKVAVKTLHKHLSHDASIKARFQREVGTVAALEHPNTIQVFDFGTMEDGTLYIVMEFVQGRSVADILEKDGPMQPQRVEHILRQVVGSLEEAHNHGIVHRDLKPDNVVLCERAGQKDWVEVLDFGIAKRSSEHDPNEAKLTQQGMVLGTPPYMSPEQFTGQPIDVRSDIYALGVMAYEMLSGKLPWEANTAWEWASKHMTEMPTPLERQPLGANVPPGMREAITRALAKDKAHRFASVREFFDTFSGGGTPASNPAAHAGGGGGAGGTAMIGAPPMAASGGGAAPMKTEMGIPIGGGAPPPHAITPGPMPSSGGGAVVPAAPMVTASSASEKKGGSGLIIGLGVLAAVLFLGAGGFMLTRGKKTTTTSGIDTSTVPTTTPSAVHSEEPPPVHTAAAPLDSAQAQAPAPAPAPAPGPGGKKPIPTPVPSGQNPPQPTPPQPTPPQPTPKTDPADCVAARAAKAQNRPRAVIVNLETKCRAAGGTP